MSAPAIKKPSVDPSNIGDCAAMQPLSGITRVNETTAVSGLGRGGFVRVEEAEKPAKR